MNIDYAQIIAQANARKEALQHFARVMHDVPEHAEQLKNALTFFMQLKAAGEALDDEGEKLITKESKLAHSVGYIAQRAAEQLNHTEPGCGRAMLDCLISMAEAS